MSLTCGGKFFRIVCIILLAGDIGVGWYTFYEMREDIDTFDGTNPHTFCTEDRIELFWIIYVGFESFATFFKILQIVHLLTELCQDKKKKTGCPFVLVILSYSSEIGSALTTILFMQYCECEDLSPSTWSVGQAEMIQKLVSGAGLVCLQLLIHATSIINKCCSMKDVVESMDEDSDPGCCVVFINIVFFLLYLAVFGAEVYYAFCS